ncbi:MAG: radical SAM family heme chaperone HemW [Acidimicrobiales bacterium]|jgi:oxygen-independent coproporphyrinogen-3 oxidase|nr:radical SAM family heme chaperone HemW [Acidimicrobiales bacterium]
MNQEDPKKFGLYLHVPFCSRRCDYCSFATWTDREHLIDQYLTACKTQAATWAPELPVITSIFIGGGTPNLVPAELLMNVVAELPIATDSEFTVECNPDLVSSDQLETYVHAGVNRISLGVQSMVPYVLASLGREHDPENVQSAVKKIRSAGITNINFDLIYGAQGETNEDWRVSLEKALSLEPNHLSTYALTVEPGTPLATDIERHPDDDDQADKYIETDRLLTAAGYSNYEISNWAQPDKESRHNLLYWNQGEYLGLGVAAHSHIGQKRFWSVRTPERFISAISKNSSVEAGSEQLDVDGWALEGRQLALRTSSGVPEEFIPREVRHLTQPADLDGNLKLTAEGRLLANEVAVRLR